MSIELKTHKIIWGSSGNMCAFPDCKRKLLINDGSYDTSVVGQEAHIISKGKNGPRGDSELPLELRDKSDNIILLCADHHKIIDDHPERYTIEMLREFKANHLNWVSQNLSVDKVKERDELAYAGYVDTFIQLAEIDSWTDWTYYAFSNSTSILYGNLRKLKELLEFITNRIWFKRYPELENAFQNFKSITSDFISLFERYMYRKQDREELMDYVYKPVVDDEKIIRTSKFYQNSEGDQLKYGKALERYKYHNELLQDLILEMTRAVNHLFDMVRMYLFPAFRIKEGIVAVNFGYSWGNAWENSRVEYQKNEVMTLYPGVRKFAEIRAQRNYAIGSGIDEDYFKYL